MLYACTLWVVICLLITIAQGGKVVTLFNVKQEAYLGVYGSFVNDCLPEFLKSPYAGQGEKALLKRSHPKLNLTTSKYFSWVS